LRFTGGVFKSGRGPNTSVTQVLYGLESDTSFFPAFSRAYLIAWRKPCFKVMMVHSFVKAYRHVVTVISGANGTVIGWGLLM
jgi:hypothetical protein